MMFFEDRSTPRIGVVYGGPQDRISAQEVSEIFSRLIIDNLIAGQLHPDIAEQWATKAAHYGRLALADEANQRHQAELCCDTPLLMKTLTDAARLQFHIPEKGK